MCVRFFPFSIQINTAKGFASAIHVYSTDSFSFLISLVVGSVIGGLNLGRTEKDNGKSVGESFFSFIVRINDSELFVETNGSVCYIRVSVLRGCP